MQVATYVRVSTPEQNLDRQLEATHQYATTLGADPTDVHTYRDKSTGTDTNRSGYHDLVDDIETKEFDAVVANSVSRLARSIRDLSRTVDHIVEDNDTELHLISEGFQLVPGDQDPYQRALLQVLGTFSELEARMAQQRVREGIQTRMQEDDYHHGPAPMGFDKNDGHLIEAENFDRVRAVLELVRDDELSKRKAARELDVARKTISRGLERPELYNL